MAKKVAKQKEVPPLVKINKSKIIREAIQQHGTDVGAGEIKKLMLSLLPDDPAVKETVADKNFDNMYYSQRRKLLGEGTTTTTTKKKHGSAKIGEKITSLEELIDLIGKSAVEGILKAL